MTFQLSVSTVQYSGEVHYSAHHTRNDCYETKTIGLRRCFKVHNEWYGGPLVAMYMQLIYLIEDLYIVFPMKLKIFNQTQTHMQLIY